MIKKCFMCQKFILFKEHIVVKTPVVTDEGHEEHTFYACKEHFLYATGEDFDIATGKVSDE